MTASEKLTIAIAAITMFIAIGQLLIMLKSAQTRKSRAKARWINKVVVAMSMATILLAQGVALVIIFMSSQGEIDRNEIFLFGLGVISIIESVVLCLAAIVRVHAGRAKREILEVEKRILALLDMQSTR